jgi:chromosome segregation ATPase
VIRLKSPATESEAVNSALFFLATQLAQIDDQAGKAARLTVDDRTELAQARRKLEELVRLVENQATAGQNVQERSAVLARQMAELNRQRESLMQQQRELQRQLDRMNEAMERAKMELRTAEEAARKR